MLEGLVSKVLEASLKLKDFATLVLLRTGSDSSQRALYSNYSEGPAGRLHLAWIDCDAMWESMCYGTSANFKAYLCYLLSKGDVIKKLLLVQIMQLQLSLFLSDSSDESVGSRPLGLFSFGPLCCRIFTTIAHWRSKVTARPSSSHEFPIAPVTALPGIRRRSATLILLGEAIPFGRPYRTHLNGLRRLLTARKRVGPLPAHRLSSRHASPRSPDHHSSSSSSSSESSPVHSLGLDASDQAHLGSLTRDVSPRLYYPPRRAPRCSEAFRRWCAALLSTWYPPTTSESLSGDAPERPMHLSSHSAGPSRKCRSLIDSAPLSMPIMGSLTPTRADLLPPRKKFRDSYSSEDSIEEDAEVGLTGTGVDMELGISDGDEVGDHVEIDHRDAKDDTEEYETDVSARDTTEVGIDHMTAPLVEEDIVELAGEDSPNSSSTRDGIVRSVEDMSVDLGDVVRDFYHHMSEVRVDRIVGIETTQRRLEADQLIASADRARMAEMIYSLRLENLKVRAMLDIERDRVSSLHLHMSLSQEEFRQIRRDHDDARGRLRRLKLYLGRHFSFRP
ncbi:hypothetical protein Tco_0456384 [Tanacetum coccineum]